MYLIGCSIDFVYFSCAGVVFHSLCYLPWFPNGSLSSLLLFVSVDFSLISTYPDSNQFPLMPLYFCGFPFVCQLLLMVSNDFVVASAASGNSRQQQEQQQQQPAAGSQQPAASSQQSAASNGTREIQTIPCGGGTCKLQAALIYVYIRIL